MNIKTSFKSDLSMLKKRNLETGGAVQKIVDSEVLRRSDPYVPFKSGALKKSGIWGTKIGSGLVVYNSPYAQRQFYNNAGKGKQGTASGGLRGKKWFPRMMADHKNDIIRTAADAAGGRYEK